MKYVPHILVLSRLLVGLLFPFLACSRVAPPILALLFLLGFLSDIFDGIIARRLGVSTLGLRRLDSRADIVFLIGAASAVFIITQAAFSNWLPWICAYAVVFLIRNAIDYIRYRASPSYHMWSGRLWALVISTWIFLALLGLDVSFLLPFTFALYAVNAMEGIAASLILPKPESDIHSLWHVLRIHRRANA